MNQNPADLINILLLNLVGLLIPLLVQVLAKAHAPATVKLVINLALSAIAGVVAPLIADHSHADWKVIGLSVTSTFVLSLISHTAILGPNALGVTGSTGAIAAALPGGLGPQGSEVPAHIDPPPAA